MLFSDKKNLREEIVEILVDKKILNTEELHEILKDIGLKYSIQAIYKQIKILISENVLVKDNKKYKINNEWKQRLIEKFNEFNMFKLPSEKEKITYKFMSPIHLEIFDKDITYGIYNLLPKSTLFVYTYHYIWPLFKKRKTSYKDFRSSHSNKKRFALYNIASSDKLDLHVHKNISNDYYKFTIDKNLSYLEKDNLTMIIGPYIIQSTFEKKSMESIDKIYKSNLQINEQINAIQDFFEKPQKCKTTIENNPKKAYKIKKAISKNFLLPESVKKELKEEESFL